MVAMDWKTILSFNHEDIADDDKEKIYESIIKMESIDVEISYNELKDIFIITQEILRHKGEQVQSLTSELDEMAVKQGEMEAEIHLNLSKNGSDHLKEQMEEKDNAIDLYKQDIEKLKMKICSLEEQIDDMCKEREDDRASTPDPIDQMDRIKELGEALNKKNHHIKELLADIQILNEENRVVRDKLNHTKEKLSEAIADIKNLSVAMTNIRGENSHLNEVIEDLNKSNTSLKNQMNELMEINKDQDAQLDEFSKQMDDRILDWKELLNEKNTEIEALQKHCIQLQNRPPVIKEIQPQYYTELMKQREEQIDHLQSKLQEATQDILSSAETIHRLREEKALLAREVERVREGVVGEEQGGLGEVEGAREEARRWRGERDDMEECLKLKEAELAEALVMINQLEGGEGEEGGRRRLRQQLRVRDEHIHRLVEENNSIRTSVDHLQLENTLMRKRLNIPMDQPISTDDILARHAARKKELMAAIKKLNLFEEQKISLQIQLRQKDKCLKKLIRQVRSCGIKIPETFLAAIITDDSARQAFENDSKEIDIDVEMHPSPLVDMKQQIVSSGSVKYLGGEERYRELVEENQGLRAGLKEILAAVKEKAATSACDITYICLEKLVQCLDVRGPERGAQESLRAMLQEARQEILQTLDLLAKESEKNKQLEEKLTAMKSKEASLKKVETKLSDVKNMKESTVIEKKETTKLVERDVNPIPDFTNVQTINETYVIPADKMYSKTLQNILKHLHEQFEGLYSSMIEIFNQSSAEKIRWQTMEEQYKSNIENMAVTLETLNSRLDEIDKEKSMKKSDSDGDLSLAEVDISKLNSLLTEKKCLERKSKYLEDLLRTLIKNNEELKLELFGVKKKMYDKLKVYEVDGQKFMFHVAELKNRLRKTVPLDIFLRQNEKLNEFESKYRSILNNVDVFSVSNTSEDVHKKLLDAYQILLDDWEKCKINIVAMVKLDVEMILKDINVGESGLEKIDMFSKLSESKTESSLLEQKLKQLESINRLMRDQLENVLSQIESMRRELSEASLRVQVLQEENITVQHREMELINKVQQSMCLDSVDGDVESINKLLRENEILRLENLQHSKDLDSLNHQINEIQHDKLVSGLEMNILRHQILDLQSENDSKAIIAKLSNEILVSHLHTAEMYKKRERLSTALQKERDRIKRLEYLLHEKEMEYDHYITRTNSKISFLTTALQCLREQYQGSVPLVVMESIYMTRRELAHRVDERRTNTTCVYVEELSSIMGVDADSVCDDGSCTHSVKLKIKESKWRRQKESLKNELVTVKEEKFKLEERISSLEENLLMLTFAFGKTVDNTGDLEKRASDGGQIIDELMMSGAGDTLNLGRSSPTVELIDIDPEEQIVENNSPKPTPKPRTFIKTSPREKKTTVKNISSSDFVLPGSPIKTLEKETLAQAETVTVIIQTEPLASSVVTCQTDFKPEIVEGVSSDQRVIDLKKQISILEDNIKEALALAAQRAETILNLETEKAALESNMAATKQLLVDKSSENIKNIEDDVKIVVSGDEKSDDETEMQQLKKILKGLKDVENEKNAMIEECKQQLDKERMKHDVDSIAGQKQVRELKIQIDNLEAECRSLKSLITSQSHTEGLACSLEQYRGKVLELEERCFQMQMEMENSHTNMLSLKSECERWKQLAADRFSELETLSRRMEEKHGEEVKSYKMENNHWLCELEQCRGELGRVKGEMNHGKVVMGREVAHKEEAIKKLHYINGNLKQQILNLQAVISASDPTFELSAISELEEEDDLSSGGIDNSRGSAIDTVQYGDAMSDITMDNPDNTDRSGYVARQWGEAVLERVRREKKMLSKQNSLLRRQIKVLAARERRVRLELYHARSLKAKSVSGAGVVMKAEEMSFLQRKIESLESQLTEKSSTHYNTHANRAVQIALWDKQKKWQEAAERWKARYEEKTRDVERLERSLEGARQTIHRMDKDRRQNDSRMSKTSRTTESGGSPPMSESSGDRVEMLLRDKERLEEEVRGLKGKLEEASAKDRGNLMQRIEAQQRRIVALELADKGKDVLVTEYERLSEQNSQLGKRNLKLESEILEMQLKVGLGGAESGGKGEGGENPCCRRYRMQCEHLENYIKLLKEENSHLISRNVEQPVLDEGYKTTSVSQGKRVSDLERTVLTLRGLIGSLQAENKRLVNEAIKDRKIGHMTKDKIIDELKNENAKLRMSIEEKDQLLEKARTLLNRAMEKKRDLQNQITLLKARGGENKS